MGSSRKNLLSDRNKYSSKVVDIKNYFSIYIHAIKLIKPIKIYRKAND